jgi:glycosyltransferase involved in cell wall biosynthesis
VIRVAIVVTDRRQWTGGYNYLRNLVEVSARHLADEVAPILFFGDDVEETDIEPFANVAGAQIVRSSAFRQSRKTAVLARSLILGVDPAIRRIFNENKIDLVFEAAQYFGWRLEQPALAWMADFQHQLLRHLFSKRAYWKRELGFRAEILSGRTIMLSSEDARSHCERFYPRTRGRTHVVRFAVTARPCLDSADRNRIIDGYGLPRQFFFLPNQFWRHKNHECVIRALGCLKMLGHDIVVAASGNPLDRGNRGHWGHLRRLVVDLGVAANFRFLGMVPSDDLRALLEGCTAMINPSMSEGWSTTVEEAKAAGTPMILSDLPVHREQAAGIAMFFDATRPQELADILLTWAPLDVEKRAKLSIDASISSQAAVKRYSKDFLEVICAAARSVGR